MTARRFAALAVIGPLLAGCYTLRPAVGGHSPEIGNEIAFDVNDAGRVALGLQMGPEISQIEGRLISRDSGAFVVGVNAVRSLRGGEQVWSGERVSLRNEWINSTYARQFSAGRTLILGAAGVGGVVYILTRGLLGGATDEPPPDPPVAGTFRGIR